jgi:hypothetical protein
VYQALRPFSSVAYQDLSADADTRSMTTMAFANTLLVLLIVAGLAASCRIAYRVAGGLLDTERRPSAALDEPERLAA